MQPCRLDSAAFEEECEDIVYILMLPSFSFICVGDIRGCILIGHLYGVEMVQCGHFGSSDWSVALARRHKRVRMVAERR